MFYGVDRALKLRPCTGRITVPVDGKWAFRGPIEDRNSIGYGNICFLDRISQILIGKNRDRFYIRLRIFGSRKFGRFEHWCRDRTSDFFGKKKADIDIRGNGSDFCSVPYGSIDSSFLQCQRIDRRFLCGKNGSGMNRQPVITPDLRRQVEYFYIAYPRNGIFELKGALNTA